MRPAERPVTDASADRLKTVVEAAEILGITPDAVRSRLRRGTLRRSPERGEDGEVLVVLEAPADQSGDQSHQSSDASNEQSATDRPTVALVEALHDQIAFLNRQLDEANRANSEHRRLLAAALERIPELEGPSDPHGAKRDGPEAASEDLSKGAVPHEPQETVERRERSWWRRFFGVE